MKYPTKYICILIFGIGSLQTTPLHGALAISTFAHGDEGWTQVNLGGDYRELADITFGDVCPSNLETNSLSFCDPDAGSWMYQAPAKFLGNQSAALDGFIEYTIRWIGDIEGIDPLDPEPHLVLVHTNGSITNGLVFQHPSNPPVNIWTNYRVELNEHAGWYYVDSTTPMNELPRATRAQIAEVLGGVSALRIRGEFTTGDDTGWLRNVILDGPSRLNIKQTSVGRVELSWASTLTNYILQATSALGPVAQWIPVASAGQNRIELECTNATRYFRLALAGNGGPTSPNPALLAWIEPGQFTMGSPTNEAVRYASESQHTVTLTKGFFMRKYEVTQGEYLAVVGNNPSYCVPTNGFSANTNRPVEMVNWTDSTNYCGLLTEQERQAGRLPSGWAYRLPTESEWEYACRGGKTTAFHFGDSLWNGMANFYTYSEYDAQAGRISTNTTGIGYLGEPTTVGSYQPNAFGLYDMHGNVLEWCQDWYGPYPTGSVIDPVGPGSGTNRVIRGGGWSNLGSGCRAAYRDFIPLDDSWLLYVGFRPILALVQP